MPGGGGDRTPSPAYKVLASGAGEHHFPPASRPRCRVWHSRTPEAPQAAPLGHQEETNPRAPDGSSLWPLNLSSCMGRTGHCLWSFGEGNEKSSPGWKADPLISVPLTLILAWEEDRALCVCSEVLLIHLFLYPRLLETHLGAKP